MNSFFARLSFALVSLVVIFNLAPLVVILGSSLSAGHLLEFPPSTLSLRWYVTALTSDQWLSSLGLSLAVAATVGIVVTIVCFLAALVTVRRRFVGRTTLELAALAPLALPHAATALVLLQLAKMLGVLGQTSGLLLGHAIVVVPFGYLLCVAGLGKVDRNLEEAAMALGATPITVFRKVTLPLMRTSIVGSFLLCFLTSFDEATVALFLRGVDVVTLPVAIFMAIQEEASPLVSAISGLLIATTVLLLWMIKKAVGLRMFVERSH